MICKKESFKKDLVTQINSNLVNENQFHRMITDIRIYLEDYNKKSNYSKLNLFCNFIHHSSLTESNFVFKFLENINTEIFTNFSHKQGSTPFYTDGMYFAFQLLKTKDKVKDHFVKLFKDLKIEFLSFLKQELGIRKYSEYSIFLDHFINIMCKKGSFDINQNQVNEFNDYILDNSLKNKKNEKVINLLILFNKLSPPPNHDLCFKRVEFIKNNGEIMVGVMNFAGIQHQFTLTTSEIL